MLLSTSVVTFFVGTTLNGRSCSVADAHFPHKTQRQTDGAEVPEEHGIASTKTRPPTTVSCVLIIMPASSTFARGSGLPAREVQESGFHRNPRLRILGGFRLQYHHRRVRASTTPRLHP